MRPRQYAVAINVNIVPAPNADPADFSRMPVCSPGCPGFAPLVSSLIFSGSVNVSFRDREVLRSASRNSTCQPWRNWKNI
jgi:hypothetical protein